MKKINSLHLLESLGEQNRELLIRSEKLRDIPAALLELPPAEGKWSVAQVLEHLNIYSRYYLTAIDRQLKKDRSQSVTVFKPGWMGQYFTGLMQPGDNGTVKNKMKAPSNALPGTRPSIDTVLDEFIQHQYYLLDLLQAAKNHDINRNRIPVSIAKFIRLKLGDAFRFITAHQQRHFLQIEYTLTLVQAGFAERLPVPA